MAKKRKEFAQLRGSMQERFIVNESRSLPIYKCWISADWQIAKMANILIARRHENGNITACIYQADLGCMGVKYSHYMYNVTTKQFNEVMGELVKHFVETPYEVVHSIILTSVEYARKYGFEPHIVFTQATSFFLESDVPLMEIPCGDENGKPLYMNSGSDTPAQEQAVLRKLKKTAGEGNFKFIPSDAEDEEDEEEENEDEINVMIDELLDLKQHDRYEAFLQIAKNRMTGKAKKHDDKRLAILADLITSETVKEEQIQQALQVVREELTHPIVDHGEQPSSLFTGITDYKSIADDYDDTFGTVVDQDAEPSRVEAALSDFRRKAGEVPIADYLRLLYMEISEHEDYKKSVKAYHDKYPDYFPFTVSWYFNRLADDTLANEEIQQCFTLLSTVKLPVTLYEFEIYFMLYASLCMKFQKTATTTDAFLKILALDRYMREEKGEIIDLYRENVEGALEALKLLKTMEYLKKKGLV